MDLVKDKKRRIKIHRSLSFTLAIALSVAIAIVVFQRSSVLSRQLSEYVNDHYLKGTPFQFSCGKVATDLVSHASVADATIRYHGTDRSLKVISVDEIVVDFDALELLKLRMIVGKLRLDKVRISVWYDEEKKPIIPKLRGLDALKEQGMSAQVEIRRFDIHDLEIAAENANSPFAIKKVDVSGSARYSQGKGTIDVDQGRASVGGKEKDISSMRAKIEFGGGRVTLNDLVIRLEQSLVMLSGRYENGRLDHVQGVFNPLNLDEFSSLGWIPEQHGELGGSVVVNGTRDSLAVTGSLTGRALSLVFSGLSLEGVVTPEKVHLSSLEGEVHGSRLKGELTYDRRSGGYSFQGECEGLDLTQGFVPDGGAPQTNLTGAVRLDYDGSEKTYEVDADLRRSVVSGFEGDSIQFAGSWNEKTGLDIHEFALTRPGVVVSGFGTIDAKSEADVVLKLQGDDLEYVTKYFKLPSIGGTVDLAAKLVGPIDALQVNVTSTWRDLTYLTARIDSGVVNAEARKAGSPHATGTVDVEGRKLFYGGWEFSSPHVLFDADAKKVAVRDFSFSKGDTLVTSDFDVESKGPTEVLVLIKHLAVQAPNMTWRNQGQPRLMLAQTSTDIDRLVLSANGCELGVSGRYAKSPNTTDLHVWGKNVDLSLIPGAGKRFRFSGVGDFDGVVRGDPENPGIRLAADIKDGTMGEVSFTHLALEGEFNDDGYRVDRFVVNDGEDSLSATGWWQHRQSPVAIAKQGVDEKAARGAGIFVDARGERFPLALLVERFRKNVKWDGVFSGHATVRETLDEPKIEVSGTVVSRADSSLALPDIRADVLYEDRRLTVRSLTADDGENRATISGALPLDFDIKKGFEFHRDAPVEFGADLSVGDLSIVAGYVDVIAAATGKLSGHLDVTGAADDPQFAGHFQIRDGALRVTGSDEVYRNVNADVTVRDNRVSLTSLTARKEKKGIVSAKGTATLKGFGVSGYAVDATFTDVPVSTVPGFQSTQSGSIRVRSHTDEQGRTVPSVTGSLNVKEAVITRTLAAQEGPPSPLFMPTESPSWLCDLELHAPKNVWIRNPEVNVEMGGDLVLKRDPSGLYLRGDLNVLRGSYTLYNNKFRITDGSFDFATATTLRPGIYLDAYTPYGRVGEVEQKIFLTLSWPADEKAPKISLSYSEAGYSEADIWAMLGGQVVTGGAAFAGGSEWNAGETATSLASNYLERILNAQMSNMTIAVDSNPVGQATGTKGSENEMSIAVGRYMSEDLYLNYRQGLKISSARQLEVEYRLSNMLLLRSEIIQYQQKGLEGTSRQATDEINFDLKFRWEY